MSVYKEEEEVKKINKDVVQEDGKKLGLQGSSLDYNSISCICDIKQEHDIYDRIEKLEFTLKDLEELFPDEMPSFSTDFLQHFFEFVEDGHEELNELTDAFCFNGKNATQLFKLGYFEYLFSLLPKSFDLILKILENACENSITWFIEIGGLYPMILMSSDPSLLDVISKILLCISVKEIFVFDDIYPPSSTLHDINPSFEEREPLNFSTLVTNLREASDPEVINRLFYSLANIFQRSEKTAKIIGIPVLMEFPGITEFPEIATSAVTAAAECIGIADIEDPFFFLDSLPELLETEDLELVPAAIKLTINSINRFGLELFEGSPAIDALLSLCSDSPIKIKKLAIDGIITVIESSSTANSGLLVDIGVIELLCDYIESLSDKTIKEILIVLTDFIGEVLLTEYDEERHDHISHGIEEIEKMQDNDSQEVSTAATVCYDKLKVFYEEWT